MFRNSRALVFTSAAVLVLAIGCQSDRRVGEVSHKDVEDVASILADTVGGMSLPVRSGPPALPADAVFTREDIPNEGGYLKVSFGEMTDDQANKLLRRLKTENCTCGCPHTVDQCLIEDPQCDTAPRLASQILKETTGGL